MQQGDPDGPVGFCIALLHSHAVWAHEQLQKVGGCVIMDMDDGYFLGPIESLIEVVRQFQNRMVEQVVSVLQPTKCEVWCHSSIRKRVRDYMQQQSETRFKMGTQTMVGGRTYYGVKVSGVPFGDDIYVQHMLKKKTGEVVSQIKATTKRLRLECQNLYALLVQCMHSKMQFWMQCMSPKVLSTHLKRFDAVMMRAVRYTTNQAFTVGSLPYKRLRSPSRLGGGMIRSAYDVAKAAYVGGICLCVPSFTTSVNVNEEGVVTSGILDHMPDQYGVGSFDVGQERQGSVCC